MQKQSLQTQDTQVKKTAKHSSKQENFVMHKITVIEKGRGKKD